MRESKSKYRALLREPGVARWSIIRVLTRFPMAAAPFSFVMLSKTELGDYSTGAWMAAGCVATEMVAAPLLGGRLDRRPMLVELRIALAVTALALLAAALGAGRMPDWILVVLAGVSGGAIAGLMGGLRMLLVRSLPATLVHTALSWESILQQAVFAVSPAVVIGLALGIDGRLPLILMASSCAVAGVLAGALRGIREAPDHGDPLVSGGSLRAVLPGGWPIYLTSAAAMYLSATIEVALSPLLQQEGQAIAWAGWLLSAFSVASVLGGYAYGTRDWPGSYRAQSLVLLTAVALLVGAAGLGARVDLIAVAVPLLAAGALQAGLITARNLSLQERIPAHSLSAGNSMLYAGSCLGYSSSSIVIALLVPHGGALRLTLWSCVLTIGVGWLGAAAEFLSARAGHVARAAAQSQ
jgi:hypothetical protein